MFLHAKHLREDSNLESEMATRILKSATAVLEAFNDARNSQSMAHDNPSLNHDESPPIVNHVARSVKSIRALGKRLKR